MCEGLWGPRRWKLGGTCCVDACTHRLGLQRLGGGGGGVKLKDRLISQKRKNEAEIKKMGGGGGSKWQRWKPNSLSAKKGGGGGGGGGGIWKTTWSVRRSFVVVEMARVLRPVLYTRVYWANESVTVTNALETRPVSDKHPLPARVPNNRGACMGHYHQLALPIFIPKGDRQRGWGGGQLVSKGLMRGWVSDEQRPHKTNCSAASPARPYISQCNRFSGVPCRDLYTTK